MRTYLLKRFLWLIPTLFIITVISYAMMRLAPGDPVKTFMLSGGSAGEDGGGVGTLREGEESTAAKQFRERFHLDKPWYVGYTLWIRNIVTEGDFGVSLTIQLGRPVWALIKERIPVTIKLNLCALAVIYLIAIPAGLYSAVFRNSIGDRTVTTIFFVLYSLPSFWVGLMLILMVSKYFPWWPTSGIHSDLPASASYWAILLDTAKRYVLPVICLAYAALAALSRYARVGMLEVIRQDYIRTARAKGLSEWKVVFKHALRNAVIPLITLMAGMLPGLIGGSVIIEFLFGIPGMGELSLMALSSRDYPVLITLFSFSTLLTLLGILLSDVMYSIVDPRITFD